MGRKPFRSGYFNEAVNAITDGNGKKTTLEPGDWFCWEKRYNLLMVCGGLHRRSPLKFHWGTGDDKILLEANYKRHGSIHTKRYTTRGRVLKFCQKVAGLFGFSARYEKCSCLEEHGDFKFVVV